MLLGKCHEYPKVRWSQQNHMQAQKSLLKHQHNFRIYYAFKPIAQAISFPYGSWFQIALVN